MNHRFFKQFVTSLLLMLVMQSASFSASFIRWKPQAQDVPQIDVVTITGTWVADETLTFTISTRDLVMTTGTTTTTTDLVAAGAEEMLEATHHVTADFTADISATVGGGEYGEFLELTISVVGSVITIEGPPGVPFTLTTAEGSAAGGITHETGGTGDSQDATGSKFLSNAGNWEGGVLPTNGDSVIFDTGSGDALYDLGVFRTNGSEVDYYFTDDYKGTIYLPETNTNNSANPYPEYRLPRFLEIEDDLDDGTVKVEFSKGIGPEGSDRGIIALDAANLNCDTLRITKGRGTGTVPKILVNGGNWSSILIEEAAVFLSPPEAQDMVGVLLIDTNITIGREGLADTKTTVHWGTTSEPNGVIGAVGTEVITVYSGSTTLYGDFTHGTPANGSMVIYGGEVRAEGFDIYSRDTFVHGGTYYPSFEADSGATAFIIDVGSTGIVDFREGSGERTIAKIRMRAGAALHDPNNLGTDIVHLVDCTIDQVSLNIKADHSLTLGAAD